MLVYVLITLVILIGIYHSFKRNEKLPKGPTGLPIVGNILQLGLKPHLQLSKWAEEFGSYYTIDLFGKSTVVINDLKTMRDLLGNINSTGKYTFPTLDIILGKDYGVVNTEGSVWFEQQKFFMKTLRQFGFHGGNQLNSVILRECNILCNWIDNELTQKQTDSLILNKALLHSVAKIVWNAITGEEDTNSEDKIATYIDIMATQFNDAFVLIFLPWLRFIAPDTLGWNKLVKTSSEFQKHIEASFEKRKLARSLNNGDITITRDVMDAYLEQAENCTDENSSFYGEKGMNHAHFGVVNALVSASETTSSTITWLVFYLLAYPDVQRKVQDEVDAAVAEKENSAIDKTKLPYLEAVILEVLRFSTLLPLGVMHRLLDDVSYEDFTLPKGTFLLPNLYHANMDINVWKDPGTFRPERFLEGTELERKRLKECVVAFQEGRRKCPGEHFAKDLTFWYAFSLVEKFSFHKEESRGVKEYLTPVPGFVFIPPKLGVVVKRRDKVGTLI